MDFYRVRLAHLKFCYRRKLGVYNLGIRSHDVVLDIEDRDLINNYEKFSVIDIKDYDYIFIPNLIDQHKDHKAVSILLKQLLEEKEHKDDLKICMYEVWATLALPNKSVDIEEHIETKKSIIK